MDEHIKKRYGNFHNPPTNWIKRRINPDYTIQYQDSEGLDHEESPKSTNTEVYKDDTTGKSYEIYDVDDLPDLEKYIHEDLLITQ